MTARRVALQPQRIPKERLDSLGDGQVVFGSVDLQTPVNVGIDGLVESLGRLLIVLVAHTTILTQIPPFGYGRDDTWLRSLRKSRKMMVEVSRMDERLVQQVILLVEIAGLTQKVLDSQAEGSTHFDSYDVAFAELTDKLRRWPHQNTVGRVASLAREVDALKGTVERLLEERGSPPPRTGFVYVLRADNGLCKIGRTNKLDRRVQTLAIQVPMDIELVYSVACNDCAKTEVLFHEKFRSKRVKGEWFRLDEDDLIWIRSQPGW